MARGRWVRGCVSTGCGIRSGPGSFSSPRSAAVSTSCTPGTARARVTSMLTMRALACALLSAAAWRAVLAETGDQDGEAPVAGGEAGEEGVVVAGALDRPRQAAEGAAQRQRHERDPRNADPAGAGRPGIGADGADLVAQDGPRQQARDEDADAERDQDAGVRARLRQQHRQVRRRRDRQRDGLAAGSVVPGARAQVLREVVGDEVQHHGHEDLVDAPAGAEDAGNGAEDRAAEDTRRQHSRHQDGGREVQGGQGERDRGGEDGAGVDLAVDADVDEAAAQAEHDGDAAEQERRDLVERLGDPAHAPQRAGQDRPEGHQDVAAHGHDEQRAHHRGEADRSEIDQRLGEDPPRDRRRNRGRARHQAPRSTPVPAMRAPIRYGSKSLRPKSPTRHPRDMTSIRSQIWSSSSRSSEIRRTAPPFWANARSLRRTKSVARTSRPRVGFMATRTTPRVSRARAMARATRTFWMLPPESVAARASSLRARTAYSSIACRVSSRAIRRSKIVRRAKAQWWSPSTKFSAIERPGSSPSSMRSSGM